MPLREFLEKRRLKHNIETAERERDRPELEAKIRQARYEGYRQAKIAQARAEGRRQATQPSGFGKALNILQGMGESAQRMESGLFGDYDPFGGMNPPRRQKKKRSRRK